MITYIKNNYANNTSFWSHLLKVVYNNVTLAISAKVHLNYGSKRESGLLNLNVPKNQEEQMQNKWIVVPEIMVTTSPDV